MQCEGIMEEFEDDIIARYKSDSEDVHTKVCAEDAKLCSKPKLQVPNESSKVEL